MKAIVDGKVGSIPAELSGSQTSTIEYAKKVKAGEKATPPTLEDLIATYGDSPSVYSAARAH